MDKDTLAFLEKLNHETLLYEFKLLYADCKRLRDELDAIKGVIR